MKRGKKESNYRKECARLWRKLEVAEADVEMWKATARLGSCMYKRPLRRSTTDYRRRRLCR